MSGTSVPTLVPLIGQNRWNTDRGDRGGLGGDPFWQTPGGLGVYQGSDNSRSREVTIEGGLGGEHVSLGGDHVKCVCQDLCLHNGGEIVRPIGTQQNLLNRVVHFPERATCLHSYITRAESFVSWVGNALGAKKHQELCKGSTLREWCSILSSSCALGPNARYIALRLPFSFGYR